VAGVGAAAAADQRKVRQARPQCLLRPGELSRVALVQLRGGIDALADLLRAALAARRPALNIDVDALADHLYTTFEGGFILCRTYSDPSAMRAQLRIYRQLVEALLRVA
jgi:hypothetical protein